MSLDLLDVNLVVTLLLTLLGVVPVLGGLPGVLISGLVDLIKIVMLFLSELGIGKPLPDEWGGRLFLIFNFVLFIVLFILLGGSPIDIPLPGEISSNLQTIIDLVAAVTLFIGQLLSGNLFHKTLTMFAPKAVSTSARQRAAKYEGLDPTYG